MKIKLIKKENTRKKSRVLKKRTVKNSAVIKLNTIVKLAHLNYNLLAFFNKNQKIKLNKNIFSIILLEESGVTNIYLNWLKNYTNNFY